MYPSPPSSHLKLCIGTVHEMTHSNVSASNREHSLQMYFILHMELHNYAIAEGHFMSVFNKTRKYVIAEV